MTSETTVVDSGEIYRALSNLGLAQDFAEAAASALMDDPLGALMCGAELAIIIGRIRRIYESVLATSSNYKNVEFGLPAKFESETSGTAPALAMALAGALTYLPNVGQGVSAAIAGGTFSESQATSLSQLVNRLRDLQAARPGTLRIEQIGGAGGVLLVPMNALLQHRGAKILSSGRSIAVQGFNENLSVLLMLGAYSAMLALGLSLLAMMVALGLLLLGGLLLLFLRMQRGRR